MASLVKRPQGRVWYVQYYLGGKLKRFSTDTDCLQIAKEKLRQFESAQARGDDLPLPTKTPIPNVLTAYVAHVRAVKTAKSAQTNVYYLRDMFGPVCEAVTVTSRKVSAAAKKRPPKPGQDRRRKAPVIEAACLEQVNTAQIAAFISGRVASRGLKPKTANRYREILCRLFSWSVEQYGLRLAGDRNPATKVERYREHAPEIRFLTLPQIDEQLAALADRPQIQAMVATLIYAGLRREELLWLTLDDVDLRSGRYGMLRVRAKTVDGERWQPKTGVNRAVAVSSTLRHYLDRYQRRITPGGWFFPSPNGRRWEPDNFSADLRAANKSAKLPWGCLDYRHTFGSQLAMNGVSLHQISKLMGNSEKVCERHYAALTPESLIDSVEFGTVHSTASVGTLTA